jgi:uncharacterized RDD family membrane protein YckC
MIRKSTMQHEIVTSEKVPFTYQVAGLGSRLLANLIDMGILILLALVGVMAGSILERFRPGLGTAIVMLWMFALMCGYFVLFEWLWLGQTPGKRLLGIRVLDWRGRPLTLGQAALRNLLRVVDILPGVYGVGFLAAMTNRESRRLGDLAADSLVVYLETTPRPLPRIIRMLSDEEKRREQLARQRVEQLTREQKQTILRVCQRRDQLRLRARAKLFDSIATYFREEKGIGPEPYESDERFVSRLAAALDRQQV